MKTPPKSTVALFAAAALMAGMAVSPMLVPQAHAQFSFHLGWQQPPHEYNDAQRQGFNYGIDAARKDMDKGLPPDPNRHWSFRRPPVPPPAQQDFRDGFHHGYEIAFQHHEHWQ